MALCLKLPVHFGTLSFPSLNRSRTEVNITVGVSQWLSLSVVIRDFFRAVREVSSRYTHCSVVNVPSCSDAQVKAQDCPELGSVWSVLKGCLLVWLGITAECDISINVEDKNVII